MACCNATATSPPSSSIHAANTTTARAITAGTNTALTRSARFWIGARRPCASRMSRDQLALDAHFAVLQLSQARRSYSLAAQADTVSASLFDLAHRRYLIGRIPLQDLLNAQSSREQAVGAFLQSQRGVWTAYYRLRRLTLYDFLTNAPIR